MRYLGDFADDSVIRIFFTTHAAAGGAVAPSDALDAADVVIYKNNSSTQKATTNGLTMTSPFDSKTGLHLLEIDTSVDTGDAGFWATGNDYSVVLNPDETVDSQTVVGALAQFSIGNRSDSAAVDRVVLALPNAAADAAGGLPISDAGGLDLDVILDVAVSSRSSHTANNVRDAILDRVLAGNHDDAGSLGKLVQAVTEERLAELDAANVPADVDTLLGRLTAVRAGYIDNLNVGGNVASQADVQGITQAQRVRVLPPPQMERPDAGSTLFRVWIFAYNESHEAEDLDALPVITAENNTGTDRSVNLSAVTKPGGTTGQYYADYTVATAHAIESLLFKVTATEGGTPVTYAQPSHVVDTTAVDFTTADRVKLDTLHDVRLTAARAGNLDNLDATISSVNTAIGALNDISAAAVWAAITDAASNKIADHVLRRSLATAAASDDGDEVIFRSIIGAIRKLTNKIAVVGTDLKIYEEDDATEAGSQALTSDAAADPIVALDTA